MEKSFGLTGTYQKPINPIRIENPYQSATQKQAGSGLRRQQTPAWYKKLAEKPLI
jgi:hypothetical protein